MHGPAITDPDRVLIWDFLLGPLLEQAGSGTRLMLVGEAGTQRLSSQTIKGGNDTKIREQEV